MKHVLRCLDRRHLPGVDGLRLACASNVNHNNEGQGQGGKRQRGSVVGSKWQGGKTDGGGCKEGRGRERVEHKGVCICQCECDLPVVAL